MKGSQGPVAKDLLASSVDSLTAPQLPPIPPVYSYTDTWMDTFIDDPTDDTELHSDVIVTGMPHAFLNVPFVSIELPSSVLDKGAYAA